VKRRSRSSLCDSTNLGSFVYSSNPDKPRRLGDVSEIPKQSSDGAEKDGTAGTGAPNVEVM
jgi:hypothetical protein